MPQGPEVSRMFGNIASRYDCANHVLSGGVDYFWRRKLVALVKVQNPSLVVDLATGSGDVAFALKKALGESTKVVGLDFCRPMLAKAELKKNERPYAKNILFDFGDCMALPLEDSSVDALTIAFGLRNFENRPKGLKEMARVLKPGGVLFILEFTQPSQWLRPIYYFYLKKILPRLASLVTRRGDAYDYLVGSIEQFPDQKALTYEISDSGFKDVQVITMTAGIVAIHRAVAYKEQ